MFEDVELTKFINGTKIIKSLLKSNCLNVVGLSVE